MTCVVGFGGKAIMTSAMHSSGTDRVYEAAMAIGLDPDDVVVNIQGDQPLFPPVVIGKLLEPLEQDPEVDMSTLYFPVFGEEEANNPNHVKVVVDSRGYALYFSRAPIPYYRGEDNRLEYAKHLGIYAYRMEFLSVFTKLPPGRLEKAEKLEQLRALEQGFRIKVIESPVDSVEVDVAEDIAHVENLLRTTQF